MAFAFFLYSLAGLFAAVFVLSASLVILQKGIFWSWLGRYGLVVAAVNLIGAAAIFDTPDGPLGCSAPASLRPSWPCGSLPRPWRCYVSQRRRRR